MGWPKGTEPQAKEVGRSGGINPGVCQTVGERWHMERTKPEAPSRPLTVFLDAGLPFRREEWGRAFRGQM